MNYPWKQDAINHAIECDPEESCGIVAILNNEEKPNSRTKTSHFKGHGACRNTHF